MGDGPGGTAQMVQIARKAGTVDIVRIDASQLRPDLLLEFWKRRGFADCSVLSTG